MYRYDEFDAKFVSERVKQFRGQVEGWVGDNLERAVWQRHAQGVACHDRDLGMLPEP